MRFVIIGGGPGRQHRGDGRGVARRRSDADRARHHRRRRAPLGLHPEQGDGRDRRRADRAHAARTRWACEAEGRLDVRRAPRAHRGHGGDAARRRHEPARVAGRAPRRAAPAGSPARTRSRPTPTRATRRSRPTRSCSSTGSRPRVPDWAPIDGERILTTRQAYPPPEIPEHLVVIGSGVTGVEFTHMFSALGSQVSLIVSRQQVLPTKDPEVAAVLEDEFLRRGVKLLKGARAIAIGREGDKVFVACDDGRAVDGSHALLAIGSMPEQRRARLRRRGRRGRRQRLHPRQPPLPDERPAHLLGRRHLGPAAALVGGGDAGPQDRRARDGAHRARAPPPRLRQGRAGDLHRSRDRRGRRRRGRGVRGRAASSGSRRCRSRRTRSR